MACVFALVGLGLMSWSLFDPTPPPVLIALSIGQGLGLLSFLGFVLVVVRDYRQRVRPSPEDEGPERR